MPKSLKRGIGASTIILSKDINKYDFMCGLNFYESDVMIFLKYMLVPRSAGPSKRASINKTELNKKLAVGGNLPAPLFGTLEHVHNKCLKKK